MTLSMFESVTTTSWSKTKPYFLGVHDEAFYCILLHHPIAKHTFHDIFQSIQAVLQEHS